MQPVTILINGSINAGKTTVAKAICALLPRTAHVEVDSLYHSALHSTRFSGTIHGSHV